MLLFAFANVWIFSTDYVLYFSCSRYRDDEELVLTDDHYEGGITEQTALTIKNATPSDMGSYRCILDNNVGTSTAEDVIEVSVLCEYPKIIAK